MNGQELATGGAVRPRGDLRRRRQRHVRDDPHASGATPIRRASSGTDLVNPDFAALARALRRAWRDRDADGEFAPAFERARAAASPRSCISSSIRRRITPNASLDALRATGTRRQVIPVAAPLTPRPMLAPPPSTRREVGARPSASRAAVPQIPAPHPRAGHGDPAGVRLDQLRLLVDGDQVGDRRRCSTKRPWRRRRGSSSTSSQIYAAARLCRAAAARRERRRAAPHRVPEAPAPGAGGDRHRASSTPTGREHDRGLAPRNGSHPARARTARRSPRFATRKRGTAVASARSISARRPSRT